MKSQEGFCRPLSRLLPAFQHKSYAAWMEFSDKLILPRAWRKEIAKLRVVGPLVLLAQKDTAGGVVVGVGESSAEEEQVYAPLWVARTLGFDFPQACKSPSPSPKLTLRLFPLKPTNSDTLSVDLPSCLSCVLCTPSGAFSPDELRQGLQHYTTLERDREIEVGLGRFW